jgi:hypothetical protein
MSTSARTIQPLTASDARYLAKLSAMVGRDAPLRFIWQVINSRPAVAGSEPHLWLVPSASVEDVTHTVDIDARLCSCDGLHYRCSHLRVADFAARLLFEMSASESASVADDESGIRPDSSVFRTEGLRESLRQ